MIDNVIILASEITKGMKSYGPISFIPINSKKISTPLIIKQIESIKQTYGNDTSIHIVVGFEQEKFIKLIQKYYPNYLTENINIIHHNTYETTNNGHATHIALNNIKTGNTILIQNGVLTSYMPKKFDKSILPVLKQNNDLFNIGLTKNRDRVEYVFYDLQYRWSEVVYLVDRDVQKLKNILQNEQTEEKFLFEIINIMIENNIILITENVSSKQITKINNKKHYI